MRFTAVAVGVALGALFNPGASRATMLAADLVGIDFLNVQDASLVSSIDMFSGTGTPIGQTFLTNDQGSPVSLVGGFNSLAFDPGKGLVSVVDGDDLLSGTLVALGEMALGNTSFFEVDPISTLNLGAQSTDVRALSFDLSGTLYMVNNDGNSADQLDDFLFSLAMDDFASGNATLVGQIMLADQTALKGVQAMATSPLGTFFGWDVFLGLVSIDPASGIATDIDPGDNFDQGSGEGLPGGVSPGVIQGLAFKGGSLFGARNDLFEIDTSSGQATLVGGIGGDGDIRGLAVVPEPSTWALLSLGLLALLVVARRRQRAWEPRTPRYYIRV